jgi:hypothetical protein
MKPMFTSVLCSAGPPTARAAVGFHMQCTRSIRLNHKAYSIWQPIGQAQRMSNCVNVDSAYIFSCFPVVLISFLVSLCTIVHRRHKRSSRRRSRTFRPGQSPRRTGTRARAPAAGALARRYPTGTRLCATPASQTLRRTVAGADALRAFDDAVHSMASSSSVALTWLPLLP